MYTTSLKPQEATNLSCENRCSSCNSHADHGSSLDQGKGPEHGSTPETGSSMECGSSTELECCIGAPLLEEGLPAGEVHRRALRARRMLAKAQRNLCYWLVEIEKRGLYRHFGARSVFHYAELYLELAPHTIAEYLRCGKEMERLPLLAEACERGEISSSAMREISRVATGETEEEWLRIARRSTYRQIERLVPLTPRGGMPPLYAPLAALRIPAVATASTPVFTEPASIIPALLDAFPEPGADLPGPLLPRSTLQGNALTGNAFPGAVTSLPHPLQDTGEAESLKAAAPPRYHAKFVAELEHDKFVLLRKALDKARKASGLRDRGELLVYIAQVYLSDDISGEHASPCNCRSADGDPCNSAGATLKSDRPSHITACPGSKMGRPEVLTTCPSSRSRKCNEKNDTTPYRITIHTYPGSTTAWVESDEGARFVPASTLSEAFCDAQVLHVQEQKPSMGEDERHGPRMRRTIPLSLRRKVLERDGHRCTVPGCGSGRFLHLHHIAPLSEGGRDRARNLSTVCSTCHRALHRGQLGVQGEAPSALTWRDRHGALLKGSHHRILHREIPPDTGVSSEGG